MGGRWRRWARGLLFAVVAAACGSDRPAGISESTYTPPTFIGGSCNPGNSGCPCSVAGDTAACGELVSTNGSYVTCSNGKSTCDGNKWGPCVGNKIVVQSLTGLNLYGGDIRFQMSPPLACQLPDGGTNYCDPNPGCTALRGSPSDVDAAGLNISDGGISIATGDGGGTHVSPPCVGLQCSVPYCGCADSFDCSGQSCCLTLGAGSNPQTRVCSSTFGCSSGQFAMCASSAECPTILGTHLVCAQSQIAGIQGPYCQQPLLVPDGGLFNWDGGVDGGPDAGPAPPPTLTTTVTGIVYDPAGNNPLFNASVYVPVNPVGTMPAFTTGVSCQTCDGAVPVDAVALATTAADGTFTLTGMPAGSNIPVVVQMGKWRREIMLRTVTACAPNVVANNCTAADPTMCMFRLPRNKFDGYNPVDGKYDHADMPQMAIVTGNADPLECVLLKAGVDPSEFSSYDVKPSAKVHFFASAQAAGSTLDSHYGHNLNGNPLWLDKGDPTPSAPTPPHYDYYDVVLDPCEGAAYDKENLYTSAATQGEPYKNLIHYTDIGGRAFVTHFSYMWLWFPNGNGHAYVPGPDNWGLQVAPWTNTSGATTSTVDPLTGFVIQTFPKGNSYAQWLNNVHATPTYGQLPLHEARQDLTTLTTAGNPGSTAWMSATNSFTSRGGGTTNIPYNPHFTFNTPYSAAPVNQCGRVVFSDFHVSASALIRSGTGTNNTCTSNAECGFTQTCVGGSIGSNGTCSEPCTVNGDCSTGYACAGAKPGNCQGVVPNATYSCPTRGGLPEALSPTQQQCLCTSDSQCPTGKCVPTLTYPGTLNQCAAPACTGAGLPSDSAGCADPQPAVLHSCPIGAAVNATQTGCICAADNQCLSNLCICPNGANCHGSGTPDAFGCQTLAPVVNYTCAVGAYNLATGSCECSADTQCISGKCFNWSGCAAGACNAGGPDAGAPDTFGCQTLVPSPNYTCPAGGYDPSTGLCRCNADNQCLGGTATPNAGQCYLWSGAQGCAAGACTASGGTPDGFGCKTLAPTPVHSCSAGAYSATLNACQCNDDGQCLGGKCFYWGSCSSTGACTASPDAGSPDGFGCQTLRPIPGFACASGSYNSTVNACWCNADSQCLSGKCFTWAQCSGTSCNASVGSPDVFNCQAVVPTLVYGCSTGSYDPVGHQCLCSDDSQCMAGVTAGKCKPWTGSPCGTAGHTCTGAGTVDAFSCQTPLPTTTLACAVGTPDSTGTFCICDSDVQCPGSSGKGGTGVGGTGKCVKVAGQNSAACGANCTGSGVYDSAYCQTAGAPAAVYGCASPGSVANASNTGCLCATDAACPTLKCVNAVAQCTGTCTGAGAADSMDCVVPQPQQTYSCSLGTTDKTSSATPPACDCNSNSECSTGQCLQSAPNANCSGAGPCSLASTGAADVVSCLIETSAQIAAKPSCAKGNCAGGNCTATGQPCYCTNDSQCVSGVCTKVAGQNDQASACGTAANCHGNPAIAHDGFDCQEQTPGVPTTPTCAWGMLDLSDARKCVCNADSLCGSGKCVQVAADNNSCASAGPCTGPTGAGQRDSLDCGLYFSSPDPTTYACAKGNSTNSCASPGGESCVCKQNSDCLSGACKTSAACTGFGPCYTPGGTDVFDGFNCLLNASGGSLPKAPTCATGTPSLSAPYLCMCTADAQCSSGKCIPSAALAGNNNCNGGGAGACSGTGTPDAFGCAPLLSTTNATTYSCSEGGCNTSGGGCGTTSGTRCYCFNDSQCPGSTCARVTGQNDVSCVGTGGSCTGPANPAAATIDAMDCVLAANGIPQTPTTTYACTTGVCGTNGVPAQSCLCAADTQCSSGKCVPVAGQNLAACTSGGPCTGVGTSYDYAFCQVIAPAVTAVTCGTGSPNVGLTSCYCDKGSECKGGSCDSNNNGGPACTGGSCNSGGTADSFNCDQTKAGEIPTACTVNPVYTCPTPLLPAPKANAGGTACVCTADSDCSSGKCVAVVGDNEVACGCASGTSCTTGTCTGSSTHDSNDCQLVTDSATGGKCAKGGCNHAGGACTNPAGGEACVCTNNTDCGTGGICVSVAGLNDTVCGGAAPTTNCTGPSGAAHDGFGCQLGQGPEPSSPPTCSVGTPSLTSTNTCAATANGQCSSGTCVKTPGNGNNAACAASGTADSYSCLTPVSAAGGFLCAKGGCNDTATGKCTAASQSCYCVADSQCLAGSLCAKVTTLNDVTCGSNCTGGSYASPAAAVGHVDGFGCTLGGGTEVAAAPTCGVGTVNLSVVAACAATGNGQCSSGTCVRTGANSSNTNCATTGTFDSYACLDPVSAGGVTCAKGACNDTATGRCTGAAGAQTCYCASDSQCLAGSHCAKVTGFNDVTCGASCTGGTYASFAAGAGLIDGFGCTLGGGTEVSAAPTCTVGTPNLSVANYCAAILDGQCASKSCIKSAAGAGNNAAAGCTGSGTADPNTQCLDPVAASGGYTCAKGGCNTSTGVCASSGLTCYCTNDDQCSTGSLCSLITGTNDVSCGSNCTGTAYASLAAATAAKTVDGFGCSLGPTPNPSGYAEVSATETCATGIVSLANAGYCAATANSQCASGACVQTAGNSNNAACTITSATAASAGGPAADSSSCWDPVSFGGFACAAGGCGTKSGGICTASAASCLCFNDSMCGTGGKCGRLGSAFGAKKNSTACGSGSIRCSGGSGGTYDAFDCLVGSGLAFATTPSATSCAPGMISASAALAANCEAKTNAACSSGTCVRTAANSNNAACASSGTADNYSCLMPVDIPAYSCAIGKCSGPSNLTGPLVADCSALGQPCLCTDNSQCGSGHCLSVSGANSAACANGHTCDASLPVGATADAHECETLPDVAGTYACTIGKCAGAGTTTGPAPADCNAASQTCLCTDNSQCGSGHCLSVSGANSAACANGHTCDASLPAGATADSHDCENHPRLRSRRTRARSASARARPTRPARPWRTARRRARTASAPTTTSAAAGTASRSRAPTRPPAAPAATRLSRRERPRTRTTARRSPTWPGPSRARSASARARAPRRAQRRRTATRRA